MNKNEKSGGFLIYDIVNDDKIILLGESNNKKRIHMYESFFGKRDSTDISCCHTAIRELIEEFFNIKPSCECIDDVYMDINKIVKKKILFFGTTYLIDFEGLNVIFQHLCHHHFELINYNNDNNFDVIKYINERNIDDEPCDGLNEIKCIKIFNLKNINLNASIKWFTQKVISKLF